MDHDDVPTLLPWYVNGSLDERDMARVSRHLEACDVCAREAEATLRDARALHTEPLSGFDEFERGRDRNFARLVARLGERRVRRVPVAAYALAAALLVVVGGDWWLNREPVDAFRALTSPLVDSDRVVLQVIFDPAASERDVRGVLHSSGGTLLGMPSRKGVYRVALADGARGEAVAAALREHPMVVWAGIEQR